MAIGVASANEHEQATTSTAAVASGSRRSRKVERGDAGDDRQVPGREAVGHALDVGAALGLLDQVDDPAEGGVAPGVRRAHAQAAELGERGGEDAVARPGFDRHRLAGDGRLVDGRLAGDDHRRPGSLARPDDDDLARLDELAGTRSPAVALDPRRLRGHGHQVAHRLRGRRW